MDPSFVKEYVEEVCLQLDTGFELSKLRKLALSAAVPALVLTSACRGPVALYGVPAYGMPWDAGATTESNCRDGLDEDRDGLTDCEDDDCDHLELCLGCFDGIDNDGNSTSDCADPTCAPVEGCAGACDNGEDDDGNGLADCSDPGCSGTDACP